MPSEKSLQIAVSCWCDQETENTEMDVALATAFAKRLDEQFLLSNSLMDLKIEIDQECRFGNDNTVTICLKLGDKIISEDSVNIPTH